nr:ribonuclease H-like domain-containing protein [Tanacetum cinerariifolium]
MFLSQRKIGLVVLLLGDRLLVIVYFLATIYSYGFKRQLTLSRSSAEAEYRGVANAVIETCWLRNLLRELHTPLSFATLIYCDNVSDVYLYFNLVQHQRTKHIEIDIQFVRDLVSTGQNQLVVYTSMLLQKDDFEALRTLKSFFPIVIIEAKIFIRNVGRVYMDSRSSCEIIYGHCFEKLNPTIKATKVDLKTPLVGFSGERSWSIGEVPLEIIIGDAPSQGQKLLTSLLNEKETPTDFLVEIPFKDNEKKEKPKEVPDSNSLQIAQEIEIAKVAIFLDSQLLEPKQESRRTKQAGINDLQTSHKGSTSRSFDQKVNRGKISFEGRYAGEKKLEEYMLSGLLLEDTKEAMKIII